MINNNVAEVIPLNINLDHGFHYLIPLSLKEAVEVGKRVTISFQNRKKVGIVVNIIKETEFQDLKEIEEVLDPIPILSREILALTDWIARYYLCPRGTVISYIVPSRISNKKIASILNNIPLASRILDKGKSYYRKRNEDNKPQINTCQYNLFTAQQTSIADNFSKPVLFHYHSYRERDLYYISLIMKTIQEGKQILVLIPDQFSCNDLKEKLGKKLGKSLAIFDKNISQNQKYLRFIMVQKEDIKVVIGTRSNIFLPFLNLGLIIVEQEDSVLYKEERVPRYHAREVAQARGLIESARVILGSGAPAIESYWQGINGHYHLKAKDYIPNTKLKNLLQTYFVDLEEEKSFQRVISFQLQQQIAECLREKKGIVLFLNRRGFASYISCGQCGQVMKCPDCSSLLSYHREVKNSFFICHNCGKKIPYSRNCPQCGKQALKPMGFGIQYVEDIIHRMFPKAVIQCFDKDVAPNLRIQQQLLHRFREGEIDILIGTQLLFQKLNFQQVYLVGFILIDHLLNIPNYRSAEITFQFIYRVILSLLEQKKPKILLIQTCQPEHHCLQGIKGLSYPLFYQKEITLRKELEYPPLTKIIRIDFAGTSEDLVRKSALEFGEFIHKSDVWSIMGRDTVINEDNLLIVKDKGRNRISLLLRMQNKKQNFEQVRKKLFSYVLKYQKHKVKLVIDVEPIRLY